MQYPTLFIGLGGTGVRILAQIKTMLLNKSPDLGLYRFLCVDVDESSYPDRPPIEPLSFKEFLNIGFYYPAFIKRVGEQDNHFNKWWYDFREWFKQSYEIGTYSDNRSSTLLFGNMYRRVRRACLYYDLLKGKGGRLPNIDEYLGAGFQPKYIIVIASLCGATGSSLFLDIGYFLKNVFPESLALGILTNPEIYLSAYHDSYRGGDKDYLRGNACATIRELEHFTKNHYEFGPANYHLVFDCVNPFSEYWFVVNEGIVSSRRDLSVYFSEIARSVTRNVISSGSFGYEAMHLPLSKNIQNWSVWVESFQKVVNNGYLSPYISSELDGIKAE